MITLIISFSLTALSIYCYIRIKKVGSKQRSSRNLNIYTNYDYTGDESIQLGAEMNEPIYEDRYSSNVLEKKNAVVLITQKNPNVYDDCLQDNKRTDFEDSYVNIEN